MAGIYNIDWQNVGRNLTFWRWRKTTDDQDAKLSANVRSVMASFQVLGDKLNTLDDETVDFLQYTGQHKVLEEFLNDKYDEVQRRIYITENDIEQLDPIKIGLSGETVPQDIEIGLSGESVLVPIKIGLSGEILLDNNFTIHIPISVIYDDPTIRSQLSNYVLAGKQYNIVTF